MDNSISDKNQDQVIASIFGHSSGGRAMGTPIPVICEEPGCGAVWFTESLVSLSAGATARMTGNKVSPCPACAGTGRIPDGEYTGLSASLFDQRDLRIVISAIHALRQQAMAGAQPHEIERTISEEYPFLSGIARFLPKNAAELAAFLSLIFTLLTYLSAQEADQKDVEVNVEVNVSQAIEEALSDLKTSQQVSQDQNKQSEEGKTPKE